MATAIGFFKPFYREVPFIEKNIQILNNHKVNTHLCIKDKRQDTMTSKKPHSCLYLTATPFFPQEINTVLT